MKAVPPKRDGKFIKWLKEHTLARVLSTGAWSVYDRKLCVPLIGRYYIDPKI